MTKIVLFRRELGQFCCGSGNACREVVPVLENCGSFTRLGWNNVHVGKLKRSIAIEIDFKMKVLHQ